VRAKRGNLILLKSDRHGLRPRDDGWRDDGGRKFAKIAKFAKIESVFAHIEGLRKWMWDGCLIDQDINRPPNPLVILNSHDFRIAQCGM
jgi:hypothetical protein